MKKILNIFIALCLVTSLFGQRASLSTAYVQNGMLLNPAYTGSQNSLTVVGGYRKQWAQLDGSPGTLNFAIHTPLKKENIALGLQLTKDKIGVNSSTSLDVNYAYRIIQDAGVISFGIAGGVKQVMNDWNDAKFIDDGDPKFTSGDEIYYVPSASFGLMYNSSKLQFGVGLPNLLGNSKKIFSSTSGKNILLHGSYNYRINHFYRLIPLAVLKLNESKYYQIEIGSILQYARAFGLGASYRVGESISAMLLYQYHANWVFTYSYDYGLNSLASIHTGSHQISLRYNFIYKVHASNPRLF